MDKAKRAAQYFCNGYNCAQSVVMAYADEAGLTEAQAAAVAGGFGGGIGGMRSHCGAMSGMVMVAGLLRGYDKDDLASKKDFYALVRTLCERFTERTGAMDFGTLLSRVNVLVRTDPSPRTEAYYATRPCARIVEIACEILEEML